MLTNIQFKKKWTEWNRYRTFYPTAAVQSSQTLDSILQDRSYMGGHKTGLNILKITEIISSTFSNHNVVKQYIDNRRKFENARIHGN